MPLSINGSSGITGAIEVQSTGSVLAGVTTVAAGSTSAPSITPTGDSNTGIFFPSADTVAIAEGGVEAARIDSSGRLGIGTVPKTWTSGYNVLQVGSASLVGQSEQDGQTTNWSNNAYFDTNDGRWEYSFADQASQITQSDGLIIFKTASTGTANAALSWTESARFNTSGNLAFPSGQGIDFSATANSSGTMTSELLSDYEEGTFTPTLTGASGSISSYNAQVGRYTKIGNLVSCYIYLWLANKGTISGSLLVSGLPFTSVNVSNTFMPINVSYYGGLSISVVQLTGYGGSNGTSVTLRRNTAANSNLSTQLDSTEINNNFDIIISSQYYTAS